MGEVPMKGFTGNMTTQEMENERKREAEAEFNAIVKPKSFDELKKLPISCKRCGQHVATHTISMTVAVVGKGRGSVVTQMHRIPVCEQCGVDIFVVVKKALKA